MNKYTYCYNEIGLVYILFQFLYEHWENVHINKYMEMKDILI